MLRIYHNQPELQKIRQISLPSKRTQCFMQHMHPNFSQHFAASSKRDEPYIPTKARHRHTKHKLLESQGPLGEQSPSPCTNQSINQEPPTEEQKVSADLGLRSRSIKSANDTGKDNDDEEAAAAETAHSPARSPRARRAPPPSLPVALGVSNPLPSHFLGGARRWKQSSRGRQKSGC